MQAMCQRLSIKPDHLKLVMHKESGINPQARNKTTGATGLIQFMPDTARGLGTSIHALYRMSATEQLTYVEKYYQPYAGKMHTAGDLYLATFYPLAIGKGKNFVIGSERSMSYAKTVARQNPAIAKHSHNGYITKASFDAYVNA